MINTQKVIVSCIIFNDKGQVLLGKRGKGEEVYPDLWGIPGGGVDGDNVQHRMLERNLEREVLEEMGIHIKDITYFESSSRQSNGVLKIFIMFTARIEEGQPKPLDETIEVKWWDVANISQNDLTPKTLEPILRAHSQISDQA